MPRCAFEHLSIRVIPLALIVLICSIGASGQRVRTPYSPGEILVKFKKGVEQEAVNSLVSSLNARTVETLGDLRWQRIVLPKGESVPSAVAEYQNLSSVESAQPNYYYSLLATPNDPQFPTTGMYGLTKISAPQAWDITTGSQTVVVANIDTGIRYTHEDLAANMWVNPGETAANGLDDDGNGFIDDVYGYDFRFNDPDPLDEFQNGHGTHTSGTIGAAGNNGLGVVGVNWNVKLMAIKIYSPSGTDTTSAMLINAYNYVRMMKNRGVNIRVTNNSYGGCAEACGFDQATKDAIDVLGDADILNVFAAGNSGTNNDVTPFYPASYTSPSILAVGASNSSDDRVFNYGPISVDLAAPGSGILSTGNDSDTHYRPLSGTSMAAPHVSGAAALLAGHNPSLSAASLKATLMNTVDVITTPTTNWPTLVKSGGRLNVFAALQNPTICSIGLAADNLLVPTKGGLVTVNAAATPNCDYRVKSNVNWIIVYGDADRSANSTLNLWIRVNPTISRSGTVRVGDRTITIRQNRGGN